MMMKRRSKMIKMFCDKCGKEIKGTTYYYIHFRADDIEANKCGISLSTSAFNTQNKFEEISREKIFCPVCIDKIIEFVGSNEDATN
jgi:ribosomal protein L37AE/L43A